MQCVWTGNQANVAQQDAITVLTVANGAVLSAVINGKTVSYSCTAADTQASATTAWFALLSNRATAPPEFQEITWANPANGVITASSATPGVPFTLTASASGGATLVQNHPQPNVSQADVGDPQNWSRGGFPMLPQAGDDIVLADSANPLLYNLTALANVRLNSFTRWQSFAGTVGLPEANPNGYVEYRPTYLKLSGPQNGTLLLSLGVGQSGSGPGRERYDVGGQATKVTVLNGGSALDEVAIRFLGTNAGNTLTLVNTSVGVAMLPGEVASLSSAAVDGAGFLELGPGCACTSLTLTGAQAVCMTAVSSIVCQQGSTLTVNTAPGQTPAVGGGLVGPGSSSSAGGTPSPTTLVVGTLLARSGSSVSWLTDANVTSLTVQTGSTFDASGDLRPFQVVNLTIQPDTCLFNDPNNRATIVNPVVFDGVVQSGPLQFGAGRTWKVT